MKLQSKYKISFIGSGKVATALALQLHEKGYHISEIWSKDFKNAGLLAKKVKSKAVRKIEKMNPETDLFILAVKDDHITECAEKISAKNPFIVHTSGTVSLRELKNISKNSGVLYPLQTFTGKAKVDFNSIPVLLEANNPIIEKRMIEIARSISKNIQRINSDQRKKIHLSAVFVSNFPNFFYTVAEKILQKEKIPFKILLPLIHQVTENLDGSLPSENQTGPAFRKDEKTIQRHLDLLNGNKEWQKIYESVSNSIMNHPLEKKKK